MSKKSDSVIALQTPKGSFKAWLLACRPRTLSISFVPLLVGTALANQHISHFNWLLLFSTFLCVPWIQIGTNLVNDALDFKKGGQLVKQLGLQRAELLSPNQFLFGGYGCFALAIFFGIPLMLAGGWFFICLLCLSIACGYLYTGGPFPLSYTGISEFFILIFYGWVGTVATYYLQVGQVSGASVLAGTQVGCLAVIPHVVNNLRDHVADALVQKKTWVVRFGVNFARWEVTFLSLIPFIIGLLWVKMENIGMAFLPFLVLPLIYRNLISIWQTEPSSAYNQFLANSARCQLLFGCLLVIGTFLG